MDAERFWSDVGANWLSLGLDALFDAGFSVAIPKKTTREELSTKFETAAAHLDPADMADGRLWLSISPEDLYAIVCEAQEAGENALWERLFDACYMTKMDGTAIVKAVERSFTAAVFAWVKAHKG